MKQIAVIAVVLWVLVGAAAAEAPALEVGTERVIVYKDGYTLISKKGTLRVTSYKDELIDLTVTCQLGGNAASATDDGAITVTDYRKADWIDFRGRPALSGHSTVEWQLTLKPGETKELSCDYAYYIR